jgi:L-asparaginase II
MSSRSSTPRYVPLVRVLRGEGVESVHHGAIVVADATGRVIHAVGDPGAVTYLRSSAKPFQIIPVLESGAADRFGLTPAEIAVGIASHAGQDFHVEAVRSILKKAGLSEELLMCGVHEPIHPPTAHRFRMEGLAPAPIHCNCSGKHAAMMSLAVHRGEPTEDYFTADHPVQTAMLEAVSSFSGVPAREIPLAIDNCTVPTFGLPLSAAATAYARLMDPSNFDSSRKAAARRAVNAMRAHPEYVGGDEVLDTDLIRVGQWELIAKRGAEAFYGIGYRRGDEGFGIAIKIADGGMGRGRNAVALGVARQLGLVPPGGLASLGSVHLPPVRDNRGRIVGRVEEIFQLA